MKKKVTKMNIGGVNIYLSNKRSLGDKINNKCYDGVPLKSHKCHIEDASRKKAI